MATIPTLQEVEARGLLCERHAPAPITRAQLASWRLQQRSPFVPRFPRAQSIRCLVPGMRGPQWLFFHGAELLNRIAETMKQCRPREGAAKVHSPRTRIQLSDTHQNKWRAFSSFIDDQGRQWVSGREAARIAGVNRKMLERYDRDGCAYLDGRRPLTCQRMLYGRSITFYLLSDLEAIAAKRAAVGDVVDASLLTYRQAAELLGATLETVRGLVSRRELTPIWKRIRRRKKDSDLRSDSALKPFLRRPDVEAVRDKFQVPEDEIELDRAAEQIGCSEATLYLWFSKPSPYLHRTVWHQKRLILRPFGLRYVRCLKRAEVDAIEQAVQASNAPEERGADGVRVSIGRAAAMYLMPRRDIENLCRSGRLKPVLRKVKDRWKGPGGKRRVIYLPDLRALLGDPPGQSAVAEAWLTMELNRTWQVYRRCYFWYVTMDDSKKDTMAKVNGEFTGAIRIKVPEIARHYAWRFWDKYRVRFSLPWKKPKTQ